MACHTRRPLCGPSLHEVKMAPGHFYWLRIVNSGQ